MCALLGLYAILLFDFTAGQQGGANTFGMALGRLRAAGVAASASVEFNLFLTSHRYVLLARVFSMC